MNKVEDSGVPRVTHAEKKQNPVPEAGFVCLYSWYSQQQHMEQQSVCRRQLIVCVYVQWDTEAWEAKSDTDYH